LVGVNVSSNDVKSLKETMVKEKLPWRSFADLGPFGQGRIASEWNLFTTPTYYVIDHKGVIRYKWAGRPDATAIDAALEKLIREAQAKNTSK
jgi:peroxiredoxin